MKPGIGSRACRSGVASCPDRSQSIPANETSVATAASSESDRPSALATYLRMSSAMRWSGLSCRGGELELAVRLRAHPCPRKWSVSYLPPADLQRLPNVDPVGRDEHETSTTTEEQADAREEGCGHRSCSASRSASACQRARTCRRPSRARARSKTPSRRPLRTASAEDEYELSEAPQPWTKSAPKRARVLGVCGTADSLSASHGVFPVASRSLSSLRIPRARPDRLSRHRNPGSAGSFVRRAHADRVFDWGSVLLVRPAISRTHAIRPFA